MCLKVYVCIGGAEVGSDFLLSVHYALSTPNNYTDLILQHEVVCLEGRPHLNDCGLCLTLVSQL